MFLPRPDSSRTLAAPRDLSRGPQGNDRSLLLTLRLLPVAASDRWESARRAAAVGCSDQGVGARSPVRDSHAAVRDPLCSPARCFTWILGHIHHRDWILSFVHVCGRSENWGARRHEVGVGEHEPLRPRPGAAGCSGLGVQA